MTIIGAQTVSMYVLYVLYFIFFIVQVYLVTAEFILPIARLSCSLQLSWAGTKSLSAGGGHIQVIAVSIVCMYVCMYACGNT